MTIGLCLRCKREVLFYDTKNKLCMSCYNSIWKHKKTLKGEISENEREKNKECFKKYYIKNKEEILVKAKNNYKYTYKAKIRNYNKCIRNDILIFFNNKCRECNSKNNLEIHHIKYIKFKKSELKNFVEVLCRGCHKKKHRLCNRY